MLRRAGLFLLCFGLPVQAIAQEAGRITGTVVASEDGRPVSEAVVQVEGQGVSAATNAVGRFEIAGVPAGVATLGVTARGYLGLKVSDVRVTAGGAATVAIELSATPNFLSASRSRRARRR